ncbi:uncharacterized protein F4822DRAFT_399459 [Hypoxylon trugodes]|uniref:uncharacterized protein n=1 Tax=Hypoxylon trugodes TaxID=326681 RepID=UPI002194150C|nr:uncharacterized protein F4822DRAFT_399459 [Hypoxylon trugodes]KAI1389722.1 hypothetical protein F4822DRAFT_399459 [Hypoxylon trugodes]
MSDSAPLLGQNTSDQYDDQQQQGFAEKWKSSYTRIQTAVSSCMNSRAKHWVILVLIILDVAGILSDIFIALITCEIGVENDEWVAPTRNGLTIFSLTLSSVFLVELLLSVFADGWGYFKSWFHSFDAFVIVAGFAVDLFEHNTAEEIASLIVILRLWRFVKIIDEFSVEASEQTEDLRKRIEDLETRNASLEAQLAQRG